MGWSQPDPEAVELALGWLRGQDPRLTLDTLSRRLREAGYGEDVILAAVTARQAELDAALPPGSDLRRRAAMILIAGFFGTWAVLSLLLVRAHDTGYSYGFGGAAAAVLGAVLVPLLLLSLIGVGTSGRLKRGVEGAMVAVLTIPFIFLVIVAGLCVVTTNGLRI